MVGIEPCYQTSIATGKRPVFQLIINGCVYFLFRDPVKGFSSLKTDSLVNWHRVNASSAVLTVGWITTILNNALIVARR